MGDLNVYARSYMRHRTLERMGHAVEAIPSEPVSFTAGMGTSPFLERVFWKIGFPLDYTHANAKIREVALRNKYDIVWIEKGNTVYPRVLRFVRKHLSVAKLISVSEDDMYALHNRSLYYAKGLSLYDVVFTTKKYNLEELKCIGARRTELFLNAYDETVHRPVELSTEDKERFSCEVGFIGTYEKERAESMLFLAEHGMRIVVWGNGWSEWENKHQNLVVKNEPLLGENYVKAINATKINLCFLRKLNRDQVTNRSAEIPACGAFMIAERTEQHKEMFQENAEAVFFSTNEELLEKVQYYLSHEEERKAIAAAGRKRCETSGYSMRAQLEKILLAIRT